MSDPNAPKKAFFKSKTFWLNVASLGLLAGKTAGFDVPAPPPELLAVANIILRIITTKGISFTDPKDS